MNRVFALLLALVAAGVPSPGPSSPDRVLPPGTATIFVATVLEAAPSAWRSVPSGMQERTWKIRLQIDRVLLGLERTRSAAGARGGTVAGEVRQSRRSEDVIWDAPGFWSYRDPKSGAKYLVFSAVTTSAEQAFADPLGVWEVAEEPDLVEDVDLVLKGLKQDLRGREAGVVEILAGPTRERSHFFARYAAGLAVTSPEPARKKLLDWVAEVGRGNLSERGRSELLRAFHARLSSSSTPARDGIRALALACLRTLASASLDNTDRATPRVESVVQVYLPWLAGNRTNFGEEARGLTREERTRAAEAARKLATFPRFPESSRQLLTRVADSLR